MLKSEYLDSLPSSVLKLFYEYQDSVLRDIVRRLSKGAYKSATWQVERLNHAGALYNDILDRLNILTGKSKAELGRIFMDAGLQTLKIDQSVYVKAGVTDSKLVMSRAMRDLLEVGLRKTAGLFVNLTRSTAIAGQEAFLNAADLIYTQVSTGAMSYTQALKEAIKGLDKDVFYVAYPNRNEWIDVALRRAVLTGVTQTTAELQLARMEELGSDLIQTSAHLGARPTHQEWQGRVFSLSGNHPKYKPFFESTHYGEVDGLCGINCRHSFYPFFEGLSPELYSELELDEMAHETVKYKGRDLSKYDATQKQRAIERKIRQAKRNQMSVKEAGLDDSEEMAKIREYQAQMRAFTKETGLQRQGEREQVVGYKPSPITRTPAQKPSPAVQKPIPSSPVGTPVSGALELPKGGKMLPKFEEALQIIDSVHGDGNLPKIPVSVRGRAFANGTFYHVRGGGAHSIKVTANIQEPKATLAHEIGHFLDYSAFGKDKTFVSLSSDPMLNDWKKAVLDSEGFKKLEEIKKLGTITFTYKGAPLTRNADTKFLRYLMGNEELWARSYAQYIAVKSGDKEMLAEIKDRIDYAYPMQWEEADFLPILKAIDELFRSLGWLK